MYSSKGSRIQLGTKAINGRANCSLSRATLDARDPPPRCDPERPSMSLTTAEAPTRAAPIGEGGFRPLDLTDELVEPFGGVTGKKTINSCLIAMVEEWLVRREWLWKRITGGLVAMIRSLTVITMIHYLWLMIGCPGLAATAPLNPERQLRKFGGTVSTEDSSASKAGLVAGP